MDFIPNKLIVLLFWRNKMHWGKNAYESSKIIQFLIHDNISAYKPSYAPTFFGKVSFFVINPFVRTKMNFPYIFFYLWDYYNMGWGGDGVCQKKLYKLGIFWGVLIYLSMCSNTFWQQKYF